MGEQAQLLPGTLDLLILKAVSLGPMHGFGVLLRIEQITRGALLAEQGALYPALHRLEHQGLLEFEWGVSDNNRRASVRYRNRGHRPDDALQRPGHVREGGRSRRRRPDLDSRQDRNDHHRQS